MSKIGDENKKMVFPAGAKCDNCLSSYKWADSTYYKVYEHLFIYCEDLERFEPRDFICKLYRGQPELIPQG